MADGFNPNKDINRYLSQQGRAPQSHLDWETWRKVGQPGTYQAPPGGGPEFQGVRGGGGGPNYDSGVNHYNMFSDMNKTIESTVRGVSMWAANKIKGSRDGKIDNDGSGSSASSGNGSDMADGTDNPTGGMSSGGSRSNRSQNASITGGASSRGMRRSRGGDFSGALAAHGIQMVQGNDNYGTVYGNMGGANVGSGSYDNSFQSKNTGGTQTAFSGNAFGGATPPGGGFPPPTPTPPPPPPGGGGTSTPPGGGGTPPPPGTPPGTPPGGGSSINPGIKNPPLTPLNAQPPALGAGPQPMGSINGRPNPPALGPGNTQRPPTYGNTEGVAGAQEVTQGPVRPTQQTLDKGDKIYGLARDPGTTPGERTAAQDKWRGMGFQGPFPQETSGQPTANVGGAPQAPTAGPTLQTPSTPQPQTPVAGPTNPAAAQPQGPSGPKMVMTPNGVQTQENAQINMIRRDQGLSPSLGYNADYEGVDMNKVNPSRISAFLPNAPRTDINAQGGSAAGPYGPPAPEKAQPAAKRAPAKAQPAAKKASAAKAQPKSTEGPTSVSSKKARPKMKADAKEAPKKKGTK